MHAYSHNKHARILSANLKSSGCEIRSGYTYVTVNGAILRHGQYWRVLFVRTLQHWREKFTGSSWKSTVYSPDCSIYCMHVIRPYWITETTSQFQQHFALRIL